MTHRLLDLRQQHPATEFLDVWKTIYLKIWQIIVKRVTVVEFGMNYRGGDWPLVCSIGVALGTSSLLNGRLSILVQQMKHQLNPGKPKKIVKWWRVRLCALRNKRKYWWWIKKKDIHLTLQCFIFYQENWEGK